MDQKNDKSDLNSRIGKLKKDQSLLHVELAEMYTLRAEASRQSKSYYQDAIEEYRKAIALFPYEPAYFASLARIYCKQDMAAEAVELYKNALLLDPDETKYQIGYALALQKWGADSQDADFHMKLGITLANLGLILPALEEYERSIRISPWGPRDLDHHIFFNDLERKARALNFEKDAKR